MSALLRTQDLSFKYASHGVFRAVSFSARRNEFIALLGVNGAGKSTLLDVLAGVRAPSAGEVYLNGRPLFEYSARERARHISHLPQGTRRDLPFTVEQIVLMGRYPSAENWFESKDDYLCAENAMDRMDCLRFRDRQFSTLSGGEQQRALLAACLAQGPTLMLFDEPSTYLDVHQQLQCFGMLAELAREGALCVAVTHDLNLALTYCSRLLVLDEGNLAKDLEVQEAASDPAWLHLLSDRLHMVRALEGRPWVRYR